MFKNLKKQIIGAVILYMFLRFVCPEQTINFWTSILIILGLFVCVLGILFKQKLYKYSVKIANKAFIVNKNTLQNAHCTVVYTPSDKIVVTNVALNNMTTKRLFSLTKDKVNIDKCWNELCRFFDEYVTLDVLSNYFRAYTTIDVTEISLAKPKSVNQVKPQQTQPVEAKKDAEINENDIQSKFRQRPEVVEQNVVGIDREYLSNIVKEGKLKRARKDKTPENKPYILGSEYEETFDLSGIRPDVSNTFDNLQNQNNDNKDLQDFGSISSNTSSLVDINRATVDEISALPGINVIVAKKIIKHRDLNGDFKSVEEFLEIAQIKSHFINKIKPLLTISQNSKTITNNPKSNKSDDDFDGRIVDF